MEDERNIENFRCKRWYPVHYSEVFLAKTPGCIPKVDATILQPNLSPPVRLRQKSEGKARLFLSGDDKNERLFGFRDQKVAGSNPVTSTTKLVGCNNLPAFSFVFCFLFRLVVRLFGYATGQYRTATKLDAPGRQPTFVSSRLAASWFLWGRR